MSHRPKQPMYLSRKHLRISRHKGMRQHRSNGIAQRYGAFIRQLRRSRDNTRWWMVKQFLPYQGPEE